jgi:peptidoglycan/xylan/chitin deacetylase (PgdA/CDA1 family)
MDTLYSLSMPQTVMTVLTYHHVGSRPPHVPHPSLTVTTEQFARQMAWLRRRGYHTITSSQWIAHRERSAPLPSKPVMLTFDDAYADLETTALPAMKRYGFTGVIFAITGRVGLPTPWDGMPTMSREQLLRCAGGGMEIGSHTRTHLDLSTLEAGKLDGEIAGSRQDLEQAGLPPVSFSYPFGRHNEAARKSAASAFALVFTEREGRNTPLTEPFDMRRTMVLPCDTSLDFALRVMLGWSPLGRLGAWFPLREYLRRIARWLGKTGSRPEFLH